MSDLDYHSHDDDIDLDINFDKFLFTREEKSKIVEAMAEPVTRHIYDNTPYDPKDPGFTKGSSTKKLFGKHLKHLREGVTHLKNQYPDGSTDVGFKRGYYPIAIWTDRGTIYQPGQYWFERAVDTMPYDDIARIGFEKATSMWGGKK